jgi:hypothetical protein
VTRAPLVLALFASLPAGCAEPEPATQVMLEIDAEPSVRADTEQLSLHVFGGESGRPLEMFASRRRATLEPVEWPWRVALVPLDPEPPRAWLLDLVARRADGTPVTATTVRGGYAPGRAVLLRVVLEDACNGVVCEGSRCQAGRCVDPLVDVATAPDLPLDGGL